MSEVSQALSALDSGPTDPHDLNAVREYWNRRPCNIRHSPAPVGTREYFDQVEARKYFVEPHIPGLAEFARWKGKRILEIGCGIGTDTINFAREGAEITAVDLSSASLEIVRRRLDVFGLKAALHEANAENLSFLPDNFFDLVYSFGVIHHTPHPRNAVTHVIRVLKPGGEFRVMIYNKWSYKVLAICLRGMLRGRFNCARLIREESEAQFGSPVTFVYNAAETRALLAGLNIEKMWVDHIFPFVIPEYVQYRYHKRWLFRVLPEGVNERLCHRLGWHRMAIARKPA